jgi:hypothetical protein
LVSDEAPAIAQPTVMNMTVVEKAALVSDFWSVPPPLFQLLQLVLHDFPDAIRPILSNFGPNWRAVYSGIRAVSYCRPGIPAARGDARELSSRAKRRIASDTGDRWAVTGSLDPPLRIQVAHIVPFALGHTATPPIAPFWQLVQLLFPDRVGYILGSCGRWQCQQSCQSLGSLA